jgi:hypothetical protein
MKTKLTLLFIFLINFCSAAKDPITQNIRGKVYDADTRQPIIGANIILLNSDPFKGTTTDFDGNFVLQDVPIGRASIQITFLGFEPKILPNLVVNSAKEVVLDIQMTESVTTLNTVEISATKNKGEVRNEMASVSARTFSVEETGRYAGSFNDPSRMVSGFAGVTGDPEGNNDISVRGNSPRGILWRLEGMEIPNPNHFGAEGGSGGPISILNADLLDNSEFYTGAFPAEYGNALSGVFDISLRKGNNQKHEFAAGISALGLDATAEGPLNPATGSSYLVNYRYSSLDLLNNLGIIDFGGIPKYQDGAYKLFMPTKKAGTFSFYGIGGYNGISQEYKDSLEENVIDKEVYNSGMFAQGVNHFMPISKNAYLKTSVNISGTIQMSEGVNKDENKEWKTYYEEDFRMVNYRGATQLNLKINAKNKIQTGIIYSKIGYDYFANYLLEEGGKLQEVLNKNGNSNTFQSYAQWKLRPNANLDVNLGFHHYYFALNKNQTFEPRLGVKWGFAPKHFLNFGAGLHSKMEPISTYIANYKRGGNDLISPNKNLDLMKAAHLVLGHEFYPSPLWQLKSEVYYQYIYDIPQGKGEFNEFFTVNQNEWFADFPLENNGVGRNYGIEFSAERFFGDGWFALTTLSLYQSEYKNEVGKWRNTRFNSQYTSNLIGGKEFSAGGKKGKSNTLGFSGKLGYIGGRWYTPVNLVESRKEGTTVLDMDNYFGKKADAIFFMNTAVYYKINKEKTTQEIKFDIQNTTNNLTPVREYYDATTNKIEYTTQLGILPNISYRIYF